MKLPYYARLKDGDSWYCKVHKREATHILLRDGMKPTVCCDPKLGGILALCNCEKPNDIEEYIVADIAKQIKKRGGWLKMMVDANIEGLVGKIPLPKQTAVKLKTTRKAKK